MHRPIFLTLTQRVLPTLKRIGLFALVLACFAFYGVIIGASL